jgi:hypothetical protein
MGYRRVCMLGVLAIAMWAFAGAGSAGATELFAGKETLKAGATIHASLTGSTTLESTDGTLVDTCTGGGLEGATSNTGGEGQAVGLEVVSLTWSGCSFTTDTLATGNLSIKWSSGLNGTVSGAGMTWTVKYAVSCRYGTGAGTTLGTITGTSETSKHATIDINAVLSEQEPKSAFCPDSTRWKATYAVTSPTGLNILDKEEATTGTELFQEATTLEKGASLSISRTAGTSGLITDTSAELADTCKGSTASGKTSSTTGTEVTVALESLTWSTCTFTTTTLTNGSLSITRKAGTNDGTVTGIGSVVTVVVFGLFDCKYGTGTGTHLGTLDGVTSGNATLPINAVIKEQGTHTFGCPETTKWVANYTVTSPGGLNIGT